MSIGSFPQKSTRRQQRSKASDIPLTAIAKVVDYLEADEEKHYGGERNHIVHSVRRLKNFLCAIDPDNPLERQRTRQKRRRAKGDVRRYLKREYNRWMCERREADTARNNCQLNQS